MRMAAMNDTTPAGFTFGHHVVALIDFLGQARDLAKWDYLPQSEDEQPEFISAVRDTYGRIMHWREQFEKMFASWLEPAGIPSWVTDPDPQDVEVFRKFQECPLGFVHFSDTIVVYSPITNPHGFLQAHNACAMIITCGVLLLSALAQKIVFRGAIEIGMAGRFPQTDLYGPVLAKAHYLESKVADYPRILVGLDLLSYLVALRDNPETDGPARANRGLAERCLRLLCQDEHGCWMVDFLSDEFATLGRSGEEWKTLCEMAFSFVVSERDRFIKQGDKKLAPRYERMATYFGARGFSTPGPGSPEID